MRAYQLLDMGVSQVTRETFADSLDMADEVLQALGLTFSDSHTGVQRFREHDERMLRETAKYHRDEKKRMELAAKARKQLESLFEKDEAEQQKSA